MNDPILAIRIAVAKALRDNFVHTARTEKKITDAAVDNMPDFFRQPLRADESIGKSCESIATHPNGCRVAVRVDMLPEDIQEEDHNYITTLAFNAALNASHQVAGQIKRIKGTQS